MVRAFYPQGRNLSIVTNTNFPPQNSSSGSGGAIDLFAEELYVDSGERGGIAYVDGGERGKVDYMDLV